MQRHLDRKGMVRWFWAPLVATLILSALWAGLSAALAHRPLAVDGVLDLREWDFNRRGALFLEGDWQFWRDRLVTPDAIADGTAPSHRLLAVPGRWTSQSVDGVPLTAEGVGTYHLRVLLPPDAPPLAMRHNQRFVAWNVMVNGSTAIHAGRVGPDAARTSSAGQKAIAAVQPVDGVLDITVQVAAFGGYGGIPRALLLGEADGIYGDWQQELALRTAFLSLCLSIGLLYLILYLLRPRDRECLVFAVMSVAIAMVQLTSNTPLGSEVLSNLPGQLLGFLNNVMFPFVWLSCLASATLLFPGSLRPGLAWPSILCILAVPVASLWTLSFPSLLTWTATLGLVLAMMALLYATLVAARRRQPLALPMAVAWTVLGLSNLALVHRIGFTGIMEAGYCFMLFLQAALLIDRLRHMLDQAKQSNARLAALNGALEDQVADRTRHLSDTVDRLQLAQERIVQSEKLASLGRLVAGVAHEVNTPVGTALTTATHLAQQVDAAERAMASGTLTRRQLADFLTEVKEAADLLTTTVERTAAVVQSFKQIAAERADDRNRRLDLHDLIKELRPAIEVRIGTPNVSLRLDTKPGLVLETNAGALTQVLGLLLGNCMDHAFSDGRPGTIQLSSHLTGDGWLELVVEDDGIGIDPMIRPRLFEPFTTTSRAEGRTGLGLHMAYTLVAGPLGGSIEVQDRPAGGTRVIVRLPASPGEKAAEPDTADTPAGQAGDTLLPAAGMSAIIT
ncbi:ATP-binding protein [Niveispirillum fermenti]|uniref:ATP-binding protein n=1 Tax=Niveispirillum fermenti TaxID=1233113 RepID=UPI003A87B31E